MTLGIAIFIVVVAVVGYFSGYFKGYKKGSEEQPEIKVVELTDLLKPPKNPDKLRTELQRKCDAVLQLSNEIAKSGALVIERQPNDIAVVKLKVVVSSE